ncbi:hypothetical protein EIP91_002108 [Steccherinum ochraceum]|uniref:Cytochrome P450-dit2 n=1 Tax=Steccherinum ochraceum TaxID=92696 RepID=A0A4R0RU42_9APHY|nr:hypothetical protein EIP91_002108 [Steccherinum ochraceum]
MNTVVIVAFVLGTFWIVQKGIAFRKAVQATHPGLRSLLNVWGIAGLLPPIRSVNGGERWQWHRKYDIYGDAGVDILSYVSALPNAYTNVALADAAAIKEVIGSRQRFPKPVELYTGLLFFGGNIVASEGDLWKKYRKVCGPSFSEPNNRLVWAETVSVMNDLFENVWGGKKEVVFDHALEVFMPIALFVVGAAAFGRRMTWNEKFVPSAPGQLSFKDTLHHVSEGFFVKIFIPKWAARFNKRYSQVHFAYDELQRYMHEMIDARRSAEKKEERHDLLSSLLDANDADEDGNSKLTDQELLANIFIFLLAGHETTAHTLCFAMALLALYPDEQSRVYEAITKAIPDGRDPTIQDLPNLSYVEAVMNETLRMHPPAINVPKVAAEDTILSTTNSAGETVVVPVPAGSGVNLHIIALHHNPKYWEDPHKFDPSRFLGDWPRDAFMPFSGGVRSCLGRRFSELETVVVLTMLLQKYKITIKEEPEFAGETFEQRKARVLKAKVAMTITPLRVPLVFTRRG